MTIAVKVALNPNTTNNPSIRFSLHFGFEAILEPNVKAPRIFFSRKTLVVADVFLNFLLFGGSSFLSQKSMGWKPFTGSQLKYSGIEAAQEIKSREFFTEWARSRTTAENKQAIGKMRQDNGARSFTSPG